MPSPPGTRIVVNSWRIYDKVADAILAEEAGEADPSTFEFYYTLMRNGHKIVLTERIEKEYAQEARDFPRVTLRPVLQHLENRGLIVRPPLKPQPDPIAGLKRKHEALVEDAIRAGARYFITSSKRWLRLADALSKDHNLLVVTPGRYTKLERDNS